MNQQHIGFAMDHQHIVLRHMTKPKEEQKSFYILMAKMTQNFLEDGRISELLVKYNKFMPVSIKFGTKTETLPKPEDAKEEDPAPTQLK